MFFGGKLASRLRLLPELVACPRWFCVGTGPFVVVKILVVVNSVICSSLLCREEAPCCLSLIAVVVRQHHRPTRVSIKRCARCGCKEKQSTFRTAVVGVGKHVLAHVALGRNILYLSYHLDGNDGGISSVAMTNGTLN